MPVFTVFERDGRNLKYIADIRANTKDDARAFWKQEFGSNYGFVVILSQAELA